MPPRPRRHQFTLSGAFLLALVAVWVIQLFALRPAGPAVVPYSIFLAELRAGNIQTVEVDPDRLIARLKAGVPAPDTTRVGASAIAPPATPARIDTGKRTAASTARGPVTVVTNRLPGIDDTALVTEMQQRGVTFAGRIEHDSAWTQALIGWLPFILLIGLYWFGMQRMARRGGPLSFGRSRAKIYDRNADQRVTFEDVAGVDEAEAELEEVVSFLKDPARYRAVGARIPKGVLLVGPPGTGKTLLARAVAGEAGVPFFSMSGSEFVEMFVGMGAARVRDLFDQAKERAPCIIFIDELDAIGKSRGGVAALATHDEREQTLNQLLVEMDGFDPGRGVIIVGATNRPEVLDQALLRPGRFDRTVVVDRPTVDGRLAILRVHARRLRVGADVRLDVVAQRTAGMVGADLANVVNEAALAAGRRSAPLVAQQDFEDAIDRIQLGLKRRGRVMNEDEKRRVAYHEGGHALVALSVEHADPVHRVTIIPRSIGSLGATLQLPAEDRYLVTRSELTDRLCVMLGGRAAEEIVLGDVSTGASNDLERATETARQMVARFGMTEALGPVTYGRSTGRRWLGGPLDLGEERNFSEETARAIDVQVRTMMDSAHDRAVGILTDRRAALEQIAQALLVKETLERPELEAILRNAGLAIRNGRREPGEPEVTVGPSEPVGTAT